MTRKRPRNRRRVETRPLFYINREFTVSIGYHDDGQIAEVWCDPPPNMTGNTADFMARDAATVISVAIQRGVPIEELAKSIARVQDSPKSEPRPATIIGEILDVLLTDTGPGPMPQGWKPAKWKSREVQTAGKGAQ